MADFKREIPTGRIVILAEFDGELRAIDGVGSAEIAMQYMDHDERAHNLFGRSPLKKTTVTVEFTGSWTMYRTDQRPEAPQEPGKLEEPPRQIEADRG